jgi:endonuclease/exonuclease/phosphatase family metal-dependent hydrolase
MLTIMTWNGFGAAQSAASFLRWKGVPDAHRFEHPDLHAAVSDVEVLCLQEVFLSESESFFEALTHPHKVRDHNRTRLRPLSFGGSGLAVASQLPLARHTMRAFAPPQVGTERFARKGMLHVRLDALGTTVDVISTHLQSGTGRRHAEIRHGQLRQLRSFIDEVATPGAAVIVCGDLNIDGSAANGRREYEAIGLELEGFTDLGAATDWVTFHPHPKLNILAHRFYASEPPQRLDYVLFRKGDAPIELASLTRTLDQPLTKHGHAPTFASDHFALRASFRRVG